MIVQRGGKVIVKIVVENPKEEKDNVRKKLIEVEQELNHNVANEIYKKFGVGLRFHL